MRPLSNVEKIVENIIVADACIDLVADYDGKRIGFAGMSRTEFHFKINLPSYSMGIRFKPGAFHALTNISAKEAMDTFLPINVIDKKFDSESFFALPFLEAKRFLLNYIGAIIQDKNPNKFILLFDELNESIPDAASEIYQKLYYSHRQCQRLFIKNYGLSPQMILCILRFQKCLNILTSGKADTNDVMNVLNYYDQSHFINDFKRNIGLTPLELVRKYAS
jgi:AraC-like DNA-binding protein